MLKNVRAGIMPPAGKPRPSDQEVGLLADWIKRDVFGVDPHDPDPGRVTIRRLNRVEYRNTVRDLTGFDFKAEEEFPPDDTGYGFDTIGDVLSVSPLLLEKYMQAAESIVAAAVPTVSRLVPERSYRGTEFRNAAGPGNGDRMSFYKKAKVSRLYSADTEGDYRFALELAVDGAFTFDPGRCTVVFKVDDRELLRETYGWQDYKSYRYSYQRTPGRRRPSVDLRDRTADPARETTHELARFADRFAQGARARWIRSTGLAPATMTGFSPRTSLPDSIPSAASMLARFWAGLRPGRFVAPSMTARSTGWWRSPKESTASRASASSKGWRGPWWPCSPRLALSFAWRRANRKPRARRSRSILTLMSTRWRRGSLIFSGRPCRTTS